MPTIESLQAKRAVLAAQREQLMANVNASSGAIAQLDELIGEDLAEQSRAKSAAFMDKMGAQPAEADQFAAERTKAAGPPWGVHEGDAVAADAPTYDAAFHENALDILESPPTVPEVLEAIGMTPPDPPEMLSVIHDDELAR